MVDSHGSIDSVFRISCILLNGLVFKESSRMNKWFPFILDLSSVPDLLCFQFPDLSYFKC